MPSRHIIIVIVVSAPGFINASNIPVESEVILCWYRFTRLNEII